MQIRREASECSHWFRVSPRRYSDIMFGIANIDPRRISIQRRQPFVLHRWRREFRQGTGNAFSGNGKQRWSEGRMAELERKICQQALVIDFLKECLQRIEEQRMLQALTGNPPSSGKSRKK